VEVVEDLGILVGYVDSAEALATDWHGDPPPVDVVRVDRPPAAGWAALTAAGFSVKPRLLLWAANAWPSEEAYLAALGKGERYMMRSARRMFEGQGLTTVVAPVDEALVTDFLALYWRQVSAMTRGWLVAVEQRDALLAAAADHFAVCAYDGATLVGSCIAAADPARDLVRLRFSAVTPQGRDANLTRVLYLEMFGEGRRRGLGRLSLGYDPNLYGHVVRPGLYRFKRAVGFAPFPSHVVDGSAPHPNADLVVRLANLTDPTLALAYPAEAAAGGGPSDDGTGLRLDVVTADPQVDVRPYADGAMADVRVRSVGRMP
jgi:hypothetical protein